MLREDAEFDHDGETAENRSKKLFTLVSELELSKELDEPTLVIEITKPDNTSIVDKLKKAGKKLQEKRNSVHEVSMKEKVYRSQSDTNADPCLLWRKGQPLFFDADSKLTREHKLMDQFTSEGTYTEELDGDSLNPLISFEFVSSGTNISPRGSQSQSDYPAPPSPSSSRFKALRRLSVAYANRPRRNTSENVENTVADSGIVRRVPTCGSLELIIKWLVSENIESKFMNCFFTTYEGIGITSEQVFYSLQNLYKSHSEDSGCPNANTHNEWQRKRILRFMNIWLESCYEEEESSSRKKLSDDIKSFVERFKKNNENFEWDYLEELANRNEPITTTEVEGDAVINISPETLSPPSSPKLKARSQEAIRKKSSRLSLVFSSGFNIGSSSASTSPLHRFTAAQFATQLHIAELKMLRSINVRKEIGRVGWSKSDGKKTCPNVNAMIDQFNKISNWVVSEVIGSDTEKKQADAIQKFIMIAGECKLRNNFNSLMEILAGLGQHITFSLRSAWELVPVKYVSQLRELEDFMSVGGNFKTYRDTIKATKELTTALHPSLPYIGLYLRDISVADEINPDFTSLEGQQTINFLKMRMIGSMLHEIQFFQSSSYLFKLESEEDPIIQNYLFNMTTLSEETIQQIQTKNRLAVSK
eukprot:TRINITY_DN1162_c0_g1_i1.p1 TRINITY_DN1162_c0_g1~~TRINITY_DN1162_c0_g1_i1.p1  ORF type:complete len:646 (+),score=206.29 TRINITY_DN1162_c0_g1_i1:594-2531(+)